MRRAGEHAVVLGGSLAGLLTARVLSEAFDRVTVLDRDDLPDEPVVRRGVPQGRHIHGLHARGREVLEELLPGLTDELVGLGAECGDVQGDVRWIHDGHVLRQQRSGMIAIAQTRPLLEGRVRARVRAIPHVTVDTGVEVLHLGHAGDRVTGVDIRGRADEVARSLPADLVVDATGRGSHLPVWLESLGYAAPIESALNVGLAYTTWRFPRRPGDLDGNLGVIIGPTVAVPRFGAMIAVEDEGWQVTAGGYLGTVAPADDVAAFREFTAGLPAPDIGRALIDRAPLGRGQVFRFPSSRRRHYERLDRFPAGLLVIGDALSSFNPFYGQGMTVAALEALALRDVLTEDAVDSGADLAPRFFRRAARIVDIPWGLAVGGDLRLPQVPGPRPVKVRVINAYVARVSVAAQLDPVVAGAFLRVANTVDRPERLLRPAIAGRVLRAAVRSGRTPRHAPAARPPSDVPPVGVEPTLGPF